MPLKTPTEPEKNSSTDTEHFRLLSPLKGLGELITLSPQKSAYQWIVAAAAILVIASSMIKVDSVKLAGNVGLVLLIVVGLRVMISPRTFPYHALWRMFVVLVAVIVIVPGVGLIRDWSGKGVGRNSGVVNLAIIGQTPTATPNSTPLQPTSTGQQRQPLILLGSKNVSQFLNEELFVPPDNKKNSVPTESFDDIDPILLELGSGDALHAAVRIFGNGQVAGAPDRVGFIGMSSCGTKVGEDNLAKQPEEHKDNYFLVIHISRQPLVLFYRGTGLKDLLREKYHSDGKLPAELGGITYDYVHLGDLAPLFADGPLTFRRFFPKGNSCTKHLFLDEYNQFHRAPQGSKEWFDWSKLKGVQDLPPNAFPAKDDFVEIMAKEQSPLGRPGSPNSIQAAVICNGKPGKRCEKTLMEDFVLIFKIAKCQDQTDKFCLPNRAECKVAHHFAKDEIKPNPKREGCFIDRQADDESRIITLGEHAPIRIAGYPKSGRLPIHD